MYCFDTSTVIEFFRGNKKVVEKISNNSKNGENIFITYITLCELYKGAFLHSNKEEKIQEIDEFALNFSILDFNIDSCKIFGNIYYNLTKSGKIIPEADLMIASIVKTNNLTLITMDKKHFNNLGIKVEVW